MTRVLLCTTFILISVLVPYVNCQEDTSVWQKFKEACKKFFDEIRAVWKDFREELTARTKDISDWTTEMWSSFKENMKKWISERNDISESEKEDMNNIIERLRMPEGKNEP